MTDTASDLYAATGWGTRPFDLSNALSVMMSEQLRCMLSGLSFSSAEQKIALIDGLLAVRFLFSSKGTAAYDAPAAVDALVFDELRSQVAKLDEDVCKKYERLFSGVELSVDQYRAVYSLLKAGLYAKQAVRHIGSFRSMCVFARSSTGLAWLVSVVTGSEDEELAELVYSHVGELD